MISNVEKSRRVRIAVAFILFVLAEASSFPRDENDQRFGVERDVPASEAGGIDGDRYSFRAPRNNAVDTKWRKVDKFRDHDREDPAEARTGDKLNRLRRETISSADKLEARTSKSKTDKKYFIAIGLEKKGRNKMKMAQEYGEPDVKRESLSRRARRQTQKSEKVDKYVREMGFYMPKAKTDCGSRGDKRDCEVKRVQRDAVLTKGANSSAPDYYAQRKKVMERYYARQREIAEKYKQVSSTPASVAIKNQAELDRETRKPASRTPSPNVVEATTSQATISSRPTSRIAFGDDVRFNLLTGNATSTRRKHEQRFWNQSSSTERYPFNVDVKINPVFSTLPSNENMQREFYYNSGQKNCTLYGSFEQKTRRKKYEACADGERRGDMDDPRDDFATGNDGHTWGSCSGRLVYQHNLLLGLRGTSKLNAMFEVIIEGPVCITCITAQRFNDTRADVTLESGGRGHNFAKLKLIGFENEGFSYILKIFGVPKVGNSCSHI